MTGTLVAGPGLERATAQGRRNSRACSPDATVVFAPVGSCCRSRVRLS
jgi:hypothetical protein